MSYLPLNSIETCIYAKLLIELYFSQDENFGSHIFTSYFSPLFRTL